MGTNSPSPGEALCFDIVKAANSDDYDHKETIEHIAGPGCKNDKGYNGLDISAEEMRGCTTFQCLARKDSTWHPEVDDQQFELNGDYFLTGLGGYMPSRDSGYGADIRPPRHGSDEIYPESDSSLVDVSIRFAHSERGVRWQLILNLAIS